MYESNSSAAIRMTITQKKRLVEFMEVHPIIAKRQFMGVELKKTFNALWEVLASELNNLDGPKKSVYKWKRVWIDLKNKTMKKAARARNTRNRTGGGPSPNPLPDNILLSEKAVYEIPTTDGIDLESDEPLPQSAAMGISVAGPSTLWSAEPIQSMSPHQLDHDYGTRKISDFEMEMQNEGHSDVSQSSTTCSTPERSTSKRRNLGAEAIQHFMKSERKFSDNLEEINKVTNTMVDCLKRSNLLLHEIRDENKKTNDLLSELLNVLKNKQF